MPVSDRLPTTAERLSQAEYETDQLLAQAKNLNQPIAACQHLATLAQVSATREASLRHQLALEDISNTVYHYLAQRG